MVHRGELVVPILWCLPLTRAGHACAYSSVLKTALTSQNYVEGQMNKYEKDDASPSIWRLLVQWIYTQKLDIRPKEIPGTEVFLELKIVEVSESTAAEYKARDIKTGEKELTLLDCLCLDLAQLYCLAHYLQMFRLQNYVMKSLVEIFKMKDVCSSPGLDLLTKARRIPVPSENLYRKLHST